MARERPEVEGAAVTNGRTETEGLENHADALWSLGSLIRLAKGDEAAESGVGSVAGGGAAPRRPRNQLPPHSNPVSGLVHHLSPARARPLPATVSPPTDGTPVLLQRIRIIRSSSCLCPPLFAQHLRAPWLEIPHQLVLATVRPTVA